MISTAAPDFLAMLGRASGRLLALDVGTKTIGLATCDSSWSFATPLETLTRGKFTADLERLAGIARANESVGLIVGLPLSMDGSDSRRTQSVRAFARNLLPLNLPILLWDERWSTVAAERAMIDQDMSRARRAEKIDAHAAAHILQGAIDALVNIAPHD
ncbi:MAG TPA: Holliday junction resolvase RuvX [Sphingomicrobium sp.]|nr:Holliday junction resolvase RuvX [Sphingomicrobium sp.]